MQVKATADFISDWLKNYLYNSEQKGYVVGISGGIDSAVTSALCARAKVPTTCITMPIWQNVKQIDRANEHIEYLQQTYGCHAISIDLSEVFSLFDTTLETTINQPSATLAQANSRSRLRMMTLYHYAGVHNYLVTGTGNKIEDFGVGFFTKYGDGGVDVSPIADLYKSQVYQLGAFLGVSKAIMEAPPTDGLFADGRNDEEQIGATYDELEWAMKYEVQNDPNVTLTPRMQEVLSIYRQRHKQNQHKMTMPPVCTLPEHLLES